MITLSHHYTAAFSAYRHVLASPLLWIVCLVIIGVQAYSVVWSHINTNGLVIRFWVYLFGFPLASMHLTLLHSWSIDMSFTGQPRAHQKLSRHFFQILQGVRLWLQSWWNGIQLSQETPSPRILVTLGALVLMPILTLGMVIALAVQGWIGSAMALVSGTTIVYTSLVQTISGIARQDFGRLSISVYSIGFTVSTIAGLIAGPGLPNVSISLLYYLLQALLLTAVTPEVASTLQLGKNASSLIAYRHMWCGMLSLMCAIFWSWYISTITSLNFAQTLYSIALSVPFTILFVQLAKTVVWYDGQESILLRKAVVAIMGLIILGLGTYGIVISSHHTGNQDYAIIVASSILGIVALLCLLVYIAGLLAEDSCLLGKPMMICATMMPTLALRERSKDETQLMDRKQNEQTYKLVSRNKLPGLLLVAVSCLFIWGIVQILVPRANNITEMKGCAPYLLEKVFIQYK